MTIEELAELTPEKLEALSDKELDEILKPYYMITRPEIAPKPQKKQEEAQLYFSPQKRAALAMLAEEGVDLSFVKYRKKK